MWSEGCGERGVEVKEKGKHVKVEEYGGESRECGGRIKEILKHNTHIP